MASQVLFLKKCWDIIHEDITQAINQVANHSSQSLWLLILAYIALLPKKENALRVSEFRPISLIHAFGKLFSKLLANRLALKLQQLVSHNQSAFIKGRNIQDNFLFVNNLVKELHSSKTPAILLKLDIAKAFDSVSWPYLLDRLRTLGFGSRWLGWICSILGSSSSKVLLNGRAGSSFMHGKGLRQGDPLSPMLFILAIDPLQNLLVAAQDEGLLQPLHRRTARFNMALYADDVVIFTRPVKDEIQAVQAILLHFGRATGMITNLTKSEVYAIRCKDLDLQDILSPFPAQLKEFPCSYLGLPLHVRKLRRLDVQPLIDRFAARLPTWKGKLLNKTGRAVLIKSTLSALPTYHLTVFPLKKWVEKKIDKIRRAFLWTGSEQANGGHCLVNWKRVCRSKDLIRGTRHY